MTAISPRRRCTALDTVLVVPLPAVLLAAAGGLPWPIRSAYPPEDRVLDLLTSLVQKS
jgi:hypothetical protein